MKKDRVTLEVSTHIILERLQDALEAGGNPHAKLIAEQIIEHLEPTDMGLSSLLLAFMGHKEKTDWMTGDECMVDPKKIYNWSCEKSEMEKAGMFHKGCIKGIIKDLDLRKKRSVVFEFDGLDGSDPNPKKMTQELTVHDIQSDKDLVLVRPNLGGML